MAPLNKESIKIISLNIVNDNQLVFKLSYSDNINDYILDNTLYIKYDEDLTEIPRSILYIPAVASVILLSWHLGADVYVPELDKDYLKSLGRLKKTFKSFYPQIPLSSINVSSIKSYDNNNFNNYGMLFSGGLDSMATYVRHRDLRPNLIHCITREKHFNTSKDHLLKFATKENCSINIVKSNINSILHEALLSAEFGVDWWGNISHSVVYTGLTAPLSIIKSIKLILIASSHTRDFIHPWGSHPLIDDNISWGNTKVKHDGYELSRQDKIKYIFNSDANMANIMKSLSIIPDHCSSPSRQAKGICGKCEGCKRSSCEKCLRTITGLVLENIDCNKCGFNADQDTFDFIKHLIIKNRLIKRKLLIQTQGALIENDSVLFFWKDIQNHIPSNLDNALYNSSSFFDWLKNFDLDYYDTHVNLFDLPRLLVANTGFYLYPYYSRLPCRFKNFIIIKKIEKYLFQRVS